jgi:chemotaxis protein CheD
MADCRVGKAPDQVLTTYALGSCIGLTLYDPETGAGGLLHFMLPDSSIDPNRAQENPFVFADTGIPRLIAQVCGQGASKRTLVAAIAGAARLLDPERLFDIGSRNHHAARTLLRTAGITLAGKAVGGTCSRRMSLELATGRIRLQENGTVRDLIPATDWKAGGRRASWPPREESES